MNRCAEGSVDGVVELVCSTIGEVLGIGGDSIAREASFFSLGLDSMALVRVAARLNELLEIDLGVGEVFGCPSVGALGRHIFTRVPGNEESFAASANDREIKRADRDWEPELSVTQQRLWFLTRLDRRASRAYHLAFGLRLRGRLHREALKSALDRIVYRHESLRTSFVASDGVARQRILPPEVGFALEESDLSKVADLEQRLRELAEQESSAEFDLTIGPLIRGHLVKVSEQEHVLLLTMHHIVSDGWSIGVLVRELTALYGASREGRADPLPPLQIQYADYAQWQRRWLQGERLQRQIEYWQSTLSGAPQLLSLPSDRPRPAVQSYEGGQVEVELGEELTAGLKELSRRHGTTLFMTVLAGWAVLLSRLSGQEEVVIGTPVANRERPEIEGLIGFFVNTLAIRVDVSGGPSTVELLARVRERVLSGQSHQGVPFEQVVEALKPERTLAHSPVFQAMLAWQNLPQVSGLPLEGLAIEGMGIEGSTSQFDLTLSLVESGGRVVGSLVYATALYERGTIERYLTYWKRLLQGMVAEEEMGVDRLEWLPEPEAQLLIQEWNRTEAEYPSQRCLHELFEEQVRRTPDAAAVVYEGVSLSYEELNVRANRLAHYLRELGVEPDARVGICVERGPEMVVGLLGIWKAGGAYVPLDAGHPRQRLEYLLADSAPVLLLVDEAGRRALGKPPLAMPIVDLKSDAQRLAAYPSRNLSAAETGLGSDHLAYVIYTSGSTGEPKGVMVEHRQVVNFWSGLERLQRRQDPCQRVAFNASIAFDASVQQLVQLLSGRTLLLIPEAVRRDSPLLLRFMEENEVQAIDCTPSQLESWIAAGLLGGARALRMVLIGGESIGEAPWGKIARCRGVDFYNVYGPSECTVDATAALVRQTPDVPTIGRPIANTKIYLLDSHRQPVPLGVTGEIYIGGAGVARGYWRRPQLTAELFVADPFSREAGARMYRTGDLGRYRADGNIEYLGRNDDQVKVRGYRIELGEIEAQLRAHAGVREAVVVAREEEPGGVKRLVGYFVAEVGQELEAESPREGLKGRLKEHLRQRLPEYMVPAALMRLDALPLTANGKLDRKALPAPEAEAYAHEDYEEPRGEVEVAVAQIWRQLLRVDRVGRKDNFFELGGHSLLAVTLVGRVLQVFGVELSVQAVFQRPRLAALAQEIEHGVVQSVPAMERADRDGELELSFTQQRLWFLAQLDQRASRAYHMALGLRLRGALDRDALKAALDRIVYRHESLRTSFVASDGVARQRILPPEVGLALKESDLSRVADVANAVDVVALEQRLRELAEQESSAEFDLSAGPPIRGHLVRISEQEHALLLTMHHIASDGWSIGVLVRELTTLYGAYREGREDPLTPLPIQYADYAQWQRRWLQGERLQRQLDYWRSTLAGAPQLLSVPSDHPRPAVQSYDGGQVEVELGEKLTAGLKELSRRHETTLFMTVLAGWAVLLSRLSGQEEVVIGTPVANRGRPEIEGLIGFFVNTLAIRVDVSGGPSTAELLARVREGVLAGQAHQDVPFEQVVEALRPERTLAHSPVFQAMLVWQNLPQVSGLPLEGLAIEGMDVGGTASPFDLTLSLMEAGGRVTGSLVYASASYERGTIERYLGYWKRLLQGMVAEEEMGVDRLEWLPEREIQLLLKEWNRTEAEYPSERCIHELIEEQVRRTPKAVAVAYEGLLLSYEELNARANRLAHYLRELGVQPDARVGICVERGPEMVVGMLGTWKAGGAYVPLDPAYPRERLRYLLTDSAPVLLLVDQAGRMALGDLPLAIPAVDLRSEAQHWARCPDRDLSAEETGLRSTHLAYVIHTSGSTGQPKGVMVEHRGVCNLAIAQIRTFGVKADSRVLQFASISFDACTFELVLALCRGAALHLMTREGVLAGEALARVLEERRITHVTLPPAVLPGLGSPEDLSGVGTVICAGEALPRVQAKRWAAGRTLFNAYGPTEATVWASVHQCQAQEEGEPPIGRPITNTKIYILDAHKRPVPIGVVGEIYIGGAGVARGYLNRLQLTAERFSTDPFSDEAGARMYRTGDLGRYQADGNIEFLGRNDDQVKVRGYRIELGEIESQLRACLGVGDALVIAREEEGGQKRLVGYYVVEPGHEPEVESLRDQLKTRLPHHMVPAALMRLDRLPLTVNGKLDRKALPAAEEAAYAHAKYEEPIGEMEVALAQIWYQLLNVTRVGRRDSFFELGGHSLLAVTLVGRVLQVFGVELSVQAVFQRPTLAALSQEIEHGVVQSVPAMERADRAGDLELSFSQQRLWFLRQLDQRASRAYHMAVGLRLRGGLHREALKGALDRIVYRHESLRTSFVASDGVARLSILPPEVGFALEESDLSQAADAASVGNLVALEPRLRELAEQESSAEFDLTEGPLIRGHLVRISEQEHVLLLTMHHIISDGWSIGVLIRELTALYGAYREGRADPLPRLQIQYADYAQWQRRWLQGERLQRQIDYWRSTLAGAPQLLSVPSDHPRPAVQIYDGGQVEVELGEELTAGLKELSRRHGTTLFMTVLAGWAVLLSRLSGQEEVVIGTPVANRGRPEIEGLIGFFVNTLAIRVDVSGGPSTVELLARVRERVLAGQANQDVPFEQVVEVLNPERSLSHSPIFQAMLAWQNLPQMGGAQLDGLAIEGMGVEASTSQFDLSLSLLETGGRVAGSLVYATTLYERGTVERYLGYWERLLKEMVADEGADVGRLQWLPESEVELLLKRWNRTEAEYPSERCVHELFEEQVRRTPNAVAVVHEEVPLSYEELDARANHLACYLQEKGVRAGEPVVILLRRCIELIVCEIAVLKCGAVYVPIDTQWPTERQAFVVRDCGARLVLTDGSAASCDVPGTEQVDVLGVSLRQRSIGRPADQPPSVSSRESAYVMYTSGSTGEPKGVVVPHRAVVRLVINNGYAQIHAGDCVGHCSNPGFDASTFEIWGALLNGARILVLPESVVLDTGRFKEALNRYGVTVLFQTTALFNQRVSALPEIYANLRCLLFGGEASDVRVVTKILQGSPPKDLLHVYGPTETTTFATWYPTVSVADEEKTIPIGRPIANTTVYLLDRHRSPVPIGVVGEIYIGGAGVARGYLNRPELTAERFVADPFNGEPEARMYRTGDLADTEQMEISSSSAGTTTR